MSFECGQQRVMRLGWERPGSPTSRSVLTNRMREYFTYGSVGGAGGNPGPYPAPNLIWGLVGVAWALFANSVFVAVYLYVLVRLAIRTNMLDLAKAIAPGLWLSLLMAAVLAGVHFGLAGALKSDAPIRYLAIMGSAGAIACVAGFLLLPDATLRTESRRWLAALRQAAHVVRRTSPLGSAPARLGSVNCAQGEQS